MRHIIYPFYLQIVYNKPITLYDIFASVILFNYYHKQSGWSAVKEFIYNFGSMAENSMLKYSAA
jgi:hypothetical protein